MNEPTSTATPAKTGARTWARAVFVVVICTSAALMLSVDEVYGGLQRTLSAAEPLIAGHPYLGAAVFVLLAAMSAILAFFSSALGNEFGTMLTTAGLPWHLSLLNIQDPET